MSTQQARKERSHDRIVTHAARLFRERGAGRVGVDEVMAAAGLTHGAFYAHFRDKSALVAEAIVAAFAQSRRALFTSLPDAHGAQWLERAAERYLARRHVEQPGAGCAAPALAAEVARAEPGVRSAFTEGLRGILALAQGRLAASRGAARSRAITTLATWVGAVALARAVDDEALSEEILQACRDATAPRSRVRKPPRRVRSGSVAAKATRRRAEPSDAR